MKVLVKSTFKFISGETTPLKKGINWIDEEINPKLAAKINQCLEKGDPQIELYKGELDGHDPKAARKKRANLEAEAAARKMVEKNKPKDKKA